MSILRAFAQDLEDKSSTHWSLVVTLLLMIFVRSGVYALIPADTFFKSLIAVPDVQDMMVMELFAFLAAGILLFIIFTIVFELFFHGGLPKKKINAKK